MDGATFAVFQNITYQVGQVALVFSQGLMHSSWKMCLQGSWRQVSSLTNSSLHTLHSVLAAINANQMNHKKKRQYRVWPPRKNSKCGFVPSSSSVSVWCGIESIASSDAPTGPLWRLSRYSIRMVSEKKAHRLANPKESASDEYTFGVPSGV